MWKTYRILSYIPALGISRPLLHHYWVSFKVFNFLVKRVLVRRRMARSILSSQKDLHKKTEFHCSYDGLFVSVEYVFHPDTFSFRVRSFIAIYE